MYTCAVNAMQMVTEDMRVDMVAQERDMELHRCSFQKQDKEKELAKVATVPSGVLVL